jgi:WD40 repeat protein
MEYKPEDESPDTEPRHEERAGYGTGAPAPRREVLSDPSGLEEGRAGATDWANGEADRSKQIDVNRAEIRQRKNNSSSGDASIPRPILATSPLDSAPLRVKGFALADLPPSVPIVAELGDSRLSSWPNVTSMAFNRDGSRLATGAGDSVIRVHDPGNARLLQTLRAQDGWVGMQFNPVDDNQLATCTDSGVVLWDLTTGKVTARHTLKASNLAFLPDGRRLLISADKTVGLLDLNTGQHSVQHADHTDWVNEVAASPDGQWLASSSADQTVRLWRSDGKGNLKVLQHEQFVGGIAFDPHSKLLASAGHGWCVNLWDVQTGEKLHTFSHPNTAFMDVQFSADGQRLAAVTFSSPIEGYFFVWNVASREEEHSFELRGNGGHFVAFQPGGNVVAIAAGESTPPRPRPSRVFLFDLDSRKVVMPVSGHSADCSAVAFAPGGEQLLSGGFDGTLREWNLKTLEETRSIRPNDGPRGGTVSAVVPSRNGKFVATSGSDGKVRLSDARTLTELMTFDGAPWGPISLSPTGDLLAAGGDGAVHLWNTTHGKVHWQNKSHAGNVTSVAFAPDGLVLASGGVDKTVKIWDVGSGSERTSYGGFGAAIQHLEYTPKGDILLVGTADGVVSLRDAANGAILGSIRAGSGGGGNFAVDPTGKFMALAGQDGSVSIWNLATQQSESTYQIAPANDPPHIRALAYSPEGRHLALGLGNGSIYLLRPGTSGSAELKRTPSD